jgi:peptidoglycan-N-acetylglucosamine deacetylase
MRKRCFFVIFVALLLGPRLSAAEDPLQPSPRLEAAPAIVGSPHYRPYETLLKGINIQVVWAGTIRSKSVALTFDDGPSPKNTPQILKILQEERVPATFFVIGQNSQRHPELLKQIHAEGHTIGNHTFSHVKLTAQSSETIRVELEKTREVIQTTTGQSNGLFRPPFGAFDARSLAEMAIRRFDAVLWSVDSRDWTHPGVQVIRKNVLSTVQSGSIVLFHDDRDQTAEALPSIIRALKEQGYHFVSVPDLIAPTNVGG